MSAARELFDSLRDWPAIQALIASKRPEGLLIDYKSGHIASGKKDEYREKHVSKPLSSLANAEGGVVAYGVKTIKIDGHDTAGGADSAPLNVNPDLIRDWASELVTPIAPGMEVRALSSPDGAQAVLLVFVPQSPLRPHMASDQHYYMRNSDGAVRMQHAHVELGFRTRQLLLAPVVCASDDAAGLVSAQVLDFCIVNVGRSPAVNVHLCIRQGQQLFSVAQRGVLAPSDDKWKVSITSHAEIPRWLGGMIENSATFRGRVEAEPVFLSIDYDDTSRASYRTTIRLIPKTNDLRSRGGSVVFERLPQRERE